MDDRSSFSEHYQKIPDFRHSEPEINEVTIDPGLSSKESQPEADPELTNVIFESLANNSDQIIVENRNEIRDSQKMIDRLQSFDELLTTAKDATLFTQTAKELKDFIKQERNHIPEDFLQIAGLVSVEIVNPAYRTLLARKISMTELINGRLIPDLEAKTEQCQQTIEAKREPSDVRATIKIRERVISDQLLPELNNLPNNDPERAELQRQIDGLRQDLAKEKQYQVDKLPANISVDEAADMLETKLARQQDILKPRRPISKAGDVWIEEEIAELNAKEKNSNQKELGQLNRDISNLREFIGSKNPTIVPAITKERVNRMSPIDILHRPSQETAEQIPAVTGKVLFFKQKIIQNLKRVFNKAA